MIKILISDINMTHANMVKESFLRSTSFLMENEIVINLDNPLYNDFEYAKTNNIPILVRSTTGLVGFLDTAKEFYPYVLGFIPAGSNNFGHTFFGTIPQVSVITGAGDIGLETGYNIEFFDNDPTQEEIIPDEHDLSSFSNSVIAAKIYEIKVRRNCSLWEARFCAQKTASNHGTWDNITGFGIINVNSAVNFNDSVPIDPFISLQQHAELIDRTMVVH